MNSKEYIRAALRTDVQDYSIVLRRLSMSQSVTDREFMLLHAMIGITTENGEFMDAMKKWLFYGKSLDFVNLREELGDLEWYIALAHCALEVNHEQTWEQNIAKLRARYPEKFTEFDALNRNLDKERQILEGR